MKWHTKTKEEIFKEFETSEKGLSKEYAKKKLAQIGCNELSKKEKIPEIFIFLKQLNNPLIYILFIAAIISIVANHFIDAIVILAVVFINATVSYVQERKAEKAIDALKKLIVSYAKVLRDGEITKVLARDLVPGDIVLLEEGDKIPADARLIELKSFRTQESSLTGESLPVEKNLKILEGNFSLGDRKNMVFMGTLVVSGTAKVVVVATANKTEIGQVARSIQEVIQPKLHFNEKVNFLTLQMAIFAVVGSLVIFLVGFFVNKLEFFDIFLFTVAALVSSIPEGLPAVLVIVLTVGARRMAKRNAVIRHLPSVETLGVATVIATDKTGTLTENSLTVESLCTSDGEFKVTGEGWEPIGKFYDGKEPFNPKKVPSLNKLLTISALCNTGTLLRKKDGYEILGDPTEVSLLVLAKKAGLDKKSLVEEKIIIIEDLPFNSETKFRATLVKSADKKQLYSVGAFEKIIEQSTHLLDKNKKIKFDTRKKEEFIKEAEELAKEGARVLGVAYREIPKHVNSVSSDLVCNLVFVGLVGMKDPPRRTVRNAISKAKNAGIRIIMQTGDHKETAIAVAREIGLITEKNPKVLSQTELEKMDPIQFQHAVRKVNIFARVTPKMKLKIIRTLQEQGQIVAMTGDGINDAPALKRADIGISMGIIGTDVAREASEIILTDDNFSSIVNAIEEGRIVFQNVRQSSFFLVTTNVAEQATILVSLFMHMPLPLLPIQLLYLNLVTDTFNGIGLAMEKGHHDVLNQSPRNKKEQILNKELIGFLILSAGLMVLGTIPLFLYFLSESVEKARTVAFLSMSMFQLFNVLNMRSLKKSVFKIGIFSNKWLNIGLAVSFLGILGIIYLPIISEIFEFIPLSMFEFIFITLITSSILVFGELWKKFKYANKVNFL